MVFWMLLQFNVVKPSFFNSVDTWKLLNKHKIQIKKIYKYIHSLTDNCYEKRVFLF